MSDKPNGKETWLSIYGLAYQECFGTDSEPPWGQLAVYAKQAEKLLGRNEAVRRWVKFCRATQDARFARPALWRQTLGQWATRIPL